MPVLELSVDGMACRRCIREVTARFRDVPGVLTVTADAAQSLITLTGSMTEEDARDALSGTAYQLRHLVDAGTEPGRGDPTAGSPR